MKTKTKKAEPEKTSREQIAIIMAELVQPTKADVIEYLSQRILGTFHDGEANMAQELNHFAAAIRLLESKA